MMNILIMILIIMIISIAIVIINMMSSKNLSYRAKLSPFECGFHPLSSSRMPISIQFFLVGLIFLIFDVEITFLIPLICMYKKFNMMTIWSSMIFMIILIIGLMLEYMDQTIE